MRIEIRLVLTVDGWERETDEDGTAVTVVDGDLSWSSVLRSGEFACSNFQTIHLAQPNTTHPRRRAATGTGAPGQALQGLQGRTQQTEQQAAFPRGQHAACDEKAHGAHPYWHLRARQSAAELPRKAALDWLRCREMSGSSPFPLASPIPQRRWQLSTETRLPGTLAEHLIDTCLPC